MRALIQRVASARVVVADEIIGQIGRGLLVFVGFVPTDDRVKLEWMLHKILNLRIFADEKNRMNLSIKNQGGGLLLVPQFTLVADVERGMRPSFTKAATPQLAGGLFAQCVELALAKHEHVRCGRFGADMQVHLINDGPVTFWLDSNTT